VDNLWISGRGARRPLRKLLETPKLPNVKIAEVCRFAQLERTGRAPGFPVLPSE